MPRRHCHSSHIRRRSSGHERHESVLAQRAQRECGDRGRYYAAGLSGRPLAGIAFQRELEARAFQLGGGDYCAPGQLVGDFIRQRPSNNFGSVLPSYKPGVRLGDLAPALPGFAIEAMREALPAFDRQIHGFAMDDALLTGVETRTSSPLRIRRGADFQSVSTRGLYPAGEGAGYAGGIMSAAIDGIRVAEAVAQAIVGVSREHA